MTTILVLPKTLRQNKILMDELACTGARIIAPPIELSLTTETIANLVVQHHVEVLLVGLEQINASFLSQCPTIRFIAKFGVGLDNIDMTAIREFGVELGWTAGVNKRSVSELVLAFALGHLRNVTPSLCLMRDGTWAKNGGRQLSNATVGIVGLGHIGLDVANILSVFGSTVLYHDILEKKSVAPLGAQAASFEEILASCDVLTFHVPSTSLTHHMLNRENVSKLKKTSLVINTARGDIVDFETTCQAVVEGRLGGFATDVFPYEPFVTSHFKHPHLYFTPHIGGNAHEAVLAMGRSAIEHILRYMKSDKR